ncbi:MAG: ATP-binding cassette domain-containing protein, partial [Myxococcota bacterium]
MPAPPGDAVTLRGHGLRKRYGRRVALDGVDLEVAPGRIVGLLGRNGAGKTTAFRIV